MECVLMELGGADDDVVVVKEMEPVFSYLE